MEKIYVGLLQAVEGGGLVQLDKTDPEIGRDIYIPEKFLSGAPFGMKVVVEITGTLTGQQQTPRGRIVEVLGDPLRPDVAILGIIRQHNLPLAFPEAVLAEIEHLGVDPEPAEIETAIQDGRKDLRFLPTITIDGEDAKDLDDAVDIERHPDGNFTLWVHIADVTHYVKPDTALDLEARQRGNSVYLVDRVLPMLPPRLSNGICSLNPDKDRLSVTCQMTIDPQGTVVRYQLFESVIRSKVRATYTEVRTILEGGEAGSGRPDWFAGRVMQMRQLAEILQEKRRRRGAIEFNFPETHVELDPDGHPVDIYPYPISFANHIIEEFMIVANETVAAHTLRHQIPAIYRVHDLPDVVKLNRFATMARSFGIKLKFKGTPTPGALADVMRQIAGKPAEQTLGQLLLRALAKAVYSSLNLGHFGLASEQYLHFTSPIRRYPDLFTHRALKDWFATRQVNRKAARQLAQSVADHCSETEQVAMDAERDTVSQKAAEYYAERLGEEYDGIISGFSQAGFYVRLANTIEGSVLYRTLDGYYEYDEERLRAVRTSGGSELRIGDPVRIAVASVNISRRFIDFVLIEHKTATSDFGSRPDRQKKQKTAQAAPKRKKQIRPARPGKKNKTERKGRKKRR